MATLDLSALLSADNALRSACEQQLDAMQESQPAMLATQLVTTLGQAGGDPTQRTLCAVLLRRRLPVMLPKLTVDWRGAVQQGMLSALSSDCDDALRRKVCDAVGRLGAELHGEAGGWPELMSFIQNACASREPKAHEAAVLVLSHMAPALAEPASWAACGDGLQAMLLAALTAETAPQVSTAALGALAALLSATASLEQTADSSAERKKCRDVASSLQAALPHMLGERASPPPADERARASRQLAARPHPPPRPPRPLHAPRPSHPAPQACSSLRSTRRSPVASPPCSPRSPRWRPLSPNCSSPCCLK